MKKICLLIICIFLSVMSFTQGMYFEDISVKEALVKAEKEKKLVFVDMCATWCIPCKMVAKTLFMEPDVGDYFDAHFVSVKCDIDTEEGKILKKKYGVRRVPTFLILQPDGEVRHWMLGGSRQKDEFIEWASRGLEKKSSLPYLEELIKQSKKMSKKNLSDYFVALEAQRESSDSVRSRLFELLSPKERCKTEYWNLFRDQFGDTKYFHFVEENIDVFRENIGRSIIDAYLFKGYEKIIRRVMFEEVKDQRNIVLVNKICSNLSNWVLKYEEKNLEKNQDGTQRILLVRANLAKAYLEGNIPKCIAYLRTLTHAGLWWDVEWFPISFVGKYGTGEEKADVRELGKSIILDLCNRREQWTFSQKFKELDINVGCFDQVLEQAKEQATEYDKPILVEFILPKDDACKEMSRLLDIEGMARVVDSLCIPVRVDASGLDGIFLRTRLKISTYPTYVLITPGEELIHLWTGLCVQECFLETLREGLHEHSSYRYLNNQYKEGKANLQEKCAYLDVLWNAGRKEEYKKVCSACFKELSDIERTSVDYWSLVSRVTCDMDEYEYIIQHIVSYEENVGQEVLESYFQETFKQMLENYQLTFLWGQGNTKKEEWSVALEKIKGKNSALRLKCSDSLLCSLNLVLSYLKSDVSSWLRYAVESLDYENYTRRTVLELTLNILDEQATLEHLPMILTLQKKVHVKPDFRYIGEFDKRMNALSTKLQNPKQ